MKTILAVLVVTLTGCGADQMRHRAEAIDVTETGTPTVVPPTLSADGYSHILVRTKPDATVITQEPCLLKDSSVGKFQVMCGATELPPTEVYHGPYERPQPDFDYTGTDGTRIYAVTFDGLRGYVEIHKVVDGVDAVITTIHIAQ